MKKFRRSTRRVSLLASGLVALSLVYALPAHATAPNNCTWTGATDNNWSTAANWSGCDGTHPQNGDNLVFDNSMLSTDTTLNNDLTGLQVGRISFISSAGNGAAYLINGNDISLSDGISDTAGPTDPFYINLNVTLTADQTFSNASYANMYYVGSGKSIILGSHTLTISGGYPVILDGGIVGSGSVRETGGGNVVVGVANPDFSGSWDVAGNTNLTVSNPDQLGTASVNVESGSQLRVVTLDLSDTAHTIANPITISGNNGLYINNVYYASDTLELSGTLTLNSDLAVDLGDFSTLNLTGKLVTNGHTLTAYDGTAFTNNAYGYDELLNAETSQPVTILTPRSTLLNSESAVKESSLAVQDTDYDYPLGVVNYTFTNAAASNQVVLTFVTDLTPSQVTARKYNAATKQYSDIAGDTITATTLGGKPALQLTYNVTDGGALDQDGTADGTIVDPVGLATPASTAGSGSSSTPQPQSDNSSPTSAKTPDTGYGAPTRLNPLVTVLAAGAIVSTSTGLAMLYRQNRTRN